MTGVYASPKYTSMVLMDEFLKPFSLDSTKVQIGVWAYGEDTRMTIKMNTTYVRDDLISTFQYLPSVDGYVWENGTTYF